MNKQTIELTDERFQDIYTNEKFRNEVAFAHGFCKSNGELIGHKTCSYPESYIVTQEQIAEAKAEHQRAKAATVAECEGKLLLTGMGMTYAERYADDVCNHRVRLEFINRFGVRYFAEFGTGRGENMRVEDCVNRTREEELKNTADWNKQNLYYIYHGQNGAGSSLQYTKQNILGFINTRFDCAFKEIVIDNYNVSTEDYVSVSPSK